MCQGRSILFNSVLLLLSLLSFSIQADPPENKVVRLTSGEWAPYTSSKLKHYGVFSHIVTEAFELSGFRVEYDFYPWKRSYILAAKGEYDGSVTWAPTEERKKDFYFSDVVVTSDKYFFHMENKPFHWETLDQIKDLVVGATYNYTYGKKFDRRVASGDLQVAYVLQDKQNIRKLMAERIDVFPMDINVAYHLIAEETSPGSRSQITHHPKVIMSTPISVVFSKNIDVKRAERLQEALNSGLNQLRANGRYAYLIERSRRGEYLLAGQ